MECRYAYPFAQVSELVTWLFCVSALTAMDFASIVDRATDACIQLFQDTGSPEIINRMQSVMLFASIHIACLHDLHIHQHLKLVWFGSIPLMYPLDLNCPSGNVEYIVLVPFVILAMNHLAHDRSFFGHVRPPKIHLYQ